MKNYLKSFNLLNAAELDWIQNVGYAKKINKNDFFILEGQICREVAFVESGFFRSFYHNSAGEEITYCFTFANSFVTAYSSFLTQEKTFENIQAVTDVSLFVISKDDIERFERLSPNWLRLSKMLAEQEYIKLEQRILLLLKENAMYRYKDLLENQAEYLQLIPLHQLASYLGITQRHLSRIRKSLLI